MKRKPIWKELNLPPPSKKPAASVAAVDPARLQEAQRGLRSNCVRTLLNALNTPPPDKSSVEADGTNKSGAENSGGEARSTDDGLNAGLAESIEKELFLRHQSDAGQEYKTAARTLVAGLKRNHDLRQRVVSGDLPPVVLVSLGSRDLATSEQRQHYDSIQERETRRVTLTGRGSAALVATTDYKCSRCSGTSCDYLDTGRRDIGKCETWGSKDGQGSSRLVLCLGCGHRWEVDDV